MNIAHKAPVDTTVGKRNGWILTVAQPDPGLMTFSVRLLNHGMALGTLPAAYVMRRIGNGSTSGLLRVLVNWGLLTKQICWRLLCFWVEAKNISTHHSQPQ